VRDAYDIIQPDVILMGNTGICGIHQLAQVAEYFGKLIIPHVISNGQFPLAFAATIHALANVDNCPMVEYPHDPPILTTETLQAYIRDPIIIDEEGFVSLPDKPGLGIEVDIGRLASV
jgi:L-alanine-DL-glutamate epimerase-like enolase superfamily enzyme